MTKNDRIQFKIFNYLIIISGIAFGIFKYFVKQKTDWGDRPYPIESDLLHIHVIAAVFFLISLGIIYKSHIEKKIQQKNSKRKKTGYLAIALVLLSIFTGYFAQISIDPSFAKFTGVSHTILSIIWTIIILIHYRRL